MAQTLNFNVQIDQSQIPSAIQQIQSGINTQLQAGAMQLGTMASGLGNTMAAMNSMGIHPGAMGFPYAVAPGAINYSLGKQPFQDRTASIVEFMRNSQQAVINRASSIVSAMDPTDIAPKLTASRGKNMLEFGINTVGSMGLGMGAAAMGSKILAGAAIAGPVGAIAGLGMSTLAYFGAGKAWAPVSKAVSRWLGTDQYNMTPEEIQKLSLERKSYADISAGFMAMAPQKYLPKMGQKIDVQSQIAFGEAISSAFMRNAELTGDINMRAAAKNTGYLIQNLNALQMTDRRGFEQNVAPIFKSVGPTAYVPTTMEQNRMVEYFKTQERRAQAYGWKSVSDQERLAFAGGVMAGVAPMMPDYSGPSIYNIMGRQLGGKSRMGGNFGAALFEAFSGRAKKDLDMSSEERGWLGGSRGISQMYGAAVLNEAATPGSMTDIGLVAIMNKGNMNNIYDMTYSASGTFSDPKKYVQYRLNRKENMRKAGAKGVDAMYRRSQQMMAEELMRTMPGMFESRYDALRFMRMESGEDDETATAMAGMIENAGKAYKFTGGSGKRVSLRNLTAGARVLVEKTLRDKGFSDPSAVINDERWDPTTKAALQGSGLMRGNVHLAELIARKGRGEVLTKQQEADIEKEMSFWKGQRGVELQGIMRKWGKGIKTGGELAQATITAAIETNMGQSEFKTASKENLAAYSAIKGLSEADFNKIKDLSGAYLKANDDKTKQNLVFQAAELAGSELAKMGIDRYQGAERLLEAGFQGTHKELKDLNKSNYHFADDGMSGSGNVDKEIAEALKGVAATFNKLASKMEK